METFSSYGQQWAYSSSYDYEDQPNAIVSPSSTISSGDVSPNQCSQFAFPIVMSQLGKSVNKLGGMYSSGKPLPLAIRRKIVAMSETGMKACDISRQLQISHGCVSKIVTKWRSTGSFEPRRIGGSKPKKTLPDVVAAVRMYKKACPTMHSLEIRKRLLSDEVCNEHNVPSLSSINRIIRLKLRSDVAEFEASVVRDLMALLANSTASDVKTEIPSTPIQTSTKEEMSTVETNLMEEAIFSMDHPSPSPPTLAPLSNMVPPIEFDGVAFPDITSIEAVFESVSPLETDQTGVRGDEGKFGAFDPYSYPLGTPVDITARALDNSDFMFDFDLGENNWTWLDQVP